MLSRQEVAAKLREAAGEMQKLASENEALKQQVIDLTAASQISSEPEATPALQKQAGFGFDMRGGDSFGETVESTPAFSADLSPEQRLDMILAGELPSEQYN